MALLKLGLTLHKGEGLAGGHLYRTMSGQGGRAAKLNVGKGRRRQKGLYPGPHGYTPACIAIKLLIMRGLNRM
jgi:hypothetical protein